MANYYTREVITAPFLLTQEMADALTMRGADLWKEGTKSETVLDGLANDRIPLQSYSIVWEDGWSDLVESYENVDAFIEEEGHNPEDFNDELRRLLWLDKEDLLHEILKVNPNENYIETQAAWSCSKMRLDGFGGSSLHVTRKGYLYVTTTSVSIHDGVASFDGEFVPWEDEDEESVDEAA